jgi:hypothetical protein
MDDDREEIERKVREGEEAPPNYHRPDLPNHPPSEPPPLTPPPADDDHASE